MVYKLISEWSNGEESQIKVYRYNYSWDNVVEYNRYIDLLTAEVIIKKTVYGLKRIDKLTQIMRVK